MTHVTEVTLFFIKPQNGLIAFASLVLNDQLYLSGIGIHRKLDGSGYRLTYPTRIVGNGQKQIFHPIRKPLTDAIENAVFNKLKEVMSDVDDRYNRPNARPVHV